MKESEAFVDDISVKGMIYALTIRSPIARGILENIECPKLPGSYYLIKAEDIPGDNSLADFPVPVLAGKNLSYIGQPVAMIAGPDESELEDLASQIDIIAEEEEPVFSAGAYDANETIVKREIVSGDTDKVFGENANIVAGTYITGIQEHWYPETHGAVAILSSPPRNKAGGTRAKKNEHGLTVYTATQWPFHVKRSVARVLGWNGVTVKVIPTVIAAHLDGKLWYPSLIACHAALAAWISGSPVKLILTKEEDFMYSPKRNKAEIEMRSALGEKGELLGTDIQLRLNLGAEGIFEDELIDQSCLGTLGVYRHEAFRLSGAAMRTNLPPQGPMAGFGLAQGFFAAERHISRIADTLGLDPAEYRKMNFLPRERGLAIGASLKDPMPLEELIDTAAAMGDYHRKWASYELLRNHRRGERRQFTGEPLRGIGISIAYQGIGFLHNNESGNGNSSAELTLKKDGSLEIKTSLASSGLPEIWLDMAREILGVNPASVKLVNDTGEAQDSGPGTLSRNIGHLTRLVERCCTAIRKQRFRDPLPITARRSYKPAKAPFWVQGKKIDPDAFSRPGSAACVVEVEIDPVSLEPVIRGIWLAADGGKILHQRRALRALKTGIAHALGWTLREQVGYEEGKIKPGVFLNYDIPSPADIPPIYVDFIRNETAGPKGIGDLPFCCVPAACIQAVSQAADHPFEKIPLRLRDIWEAGKQKETENVT